MEPYQNLQEHPGKSLAKAPTVATLVVDVNGEGAGRDPANLTNLDDDSRMMPEEDELEGADTKANLAYGGSPRLKRNATSKIFKDNDADGMQVTVGASQDLVDAKLMKLVGNPYGNDIPVMRPGNFKKIKDLPSNQTQIAAQSPKDPKMTKPNIMNIVESYRLDSRGSEVSSKFKKV